jgi:ribosomal protein S18 acetylase RimI-like enzyme
MRHERLSTTGGTYLQENGLVARTLLNESEFEQITALAEVVRGVDGVDVKLNWEMMRQRDGLCPADFCYLENDRIVGYMPLDGFGASYEITAIVDPAYRRRGIFRALFNAARQEAIARGASELLLVGYRGSAAGNAAIARLGVTYTSSEYRMTAHHAAMPEFPTSETELEMVQEADAEELSRLLSLAFGDSHYHAVDRLIDAIRRPDCRYYFARVYRERVGQIGVVTTPRGAYIRGVGIVPERRRQGLGRQLLALTVAQMVSEGYHDLSLDVATQNDGALNIYRSCGFHEEMVYDYYSVPLM